MYDSFCKNKFTEKVQNEKVETLGSGDLSAVVKCPEGENINEWLAINTVDFYNTTNLLYGSITEVCTKDTCPMMCAGEKFEYLWMDKNKYKKPTKLSAPEYVENLMDWILKVINNEKLFPSDPAKLSKDIFVQTVKTIFKRLFRVYAHMYYSHYDQMKELDIHKHLNTSFKHFMCFVLEFDLVDKKELAPLKKTICSLCNTIF